MEYVIIGNGVAGMEAALAIRKHDAGGKIQMLSESIHPYYYRPKLIDYLANEIALDRLIIYKKEFYEKNRIDQILGIHIVKIEPEKNAALDEKGGIFHYDRLLLATGARSFVPPIKGAEMDGVFTMRGVRDADRIKSYCGSVSNIAVIGGGLLGLETAHSLAKTGKKVTIVEFCRWLLPRQLDEAGGKILIKLLEAKGLSFVLNDSVLSIEGSAGRLERILMQSGKEIPAGAVVISSGIRCRSELAAGCGIAINNGIIVDDFMRTSVPNIYAAGDPIEHRGKLYGIWPAAREQGRIAGLNMAGVETGYSGTILSAALKITGIDLYSAGSFEAPNSEVLVSEGDVTYKKFLLNESNPIGAIVLGDAEAVKLAQKVIEGKIHPDEFKKTF